MLRFPKPTDRREEVINKHSGHYLVDVPDAGQCLFYAMMAFTDLDYVEDQLIPDE